VRAIAHQPARSVTLTPLSAARARSARADPRYLGRLLEGQPLMAGDRVRIDLLGTGAQDFRVADVSPPGVALVVPGTRVLLKGDGADAPGAERAAAVSYEDIGGLHREIQRIREMIELPLKYPEVFERLGIDAPRGVLLHVPPGCGKTLIARAVASETSAHFIHIAGPEIMAKFYGEAEANLRAMFDDARRHAPAIVFIDEIDAIAPKREEMAGDKQVERRVVSQLLALMDGLKERGQIIVIGATNLPNTLDPALRRPGRFDREIVIGIPDARGRREILDIHTRGMPLQIADSGLPLRVADSGLTILKSEIRNPQSEVDLERLARDTAGRNIAFRTTWPLAGDLDGSSAVDALLDAYRDRILTTARANVRAPTDRRYATAGACASCHSDRFAQWMFDPHPRAMDSLRARGAEADPECVGCHSTGFGRPGGFAELAPAVLEAYKGVQCEACHGPMKGHDGSTDVHGDAVTQATCLPCHDEANSPQFVYAQYLSRLSCSRMRGGTDGPSTVTPVPLRTPAP
jgi:MoxR-like ATPase